MITNEQQFLQGVRDCRAQRTPPANATEDYLRGYNRELERMERQVQKWEGQEWQLTTTR